jgi:Na+/proline symporter/GAF domain-containing protein
MSVTAVALITFLYVGLLFGVAYYADFLRKQNRSIISNPYIYSLSFAVYLTSWTFFGSVGRAATTGLDFLPIYLGPTLIAFTWMFLLRKIIRISKEQNIVSIADFISSRYGKSQTIGSLVTLFALIGIMPYIALQLKAIAHTFENLTRIHPSQLTWMDQTLSQIPFVDTAFVVAFLLSLFAVLFGARHLDTTERHEGLVAAIALEAIVKLIAFVAVGIFVTYGLFDGFGDIFTQFRTQFPEREYLLYLAPDHTSYVRWFTLIFISMMAFMFLPRQFHIMVIENSNLDHVKSAMWRFPAYMFLINLFVIPIALGGLILYQGDTSNADYFVLSIPLDTGHEWLALFTFLGGFSASAGMVMVSSVALSTMILNHLVMPIILRFNLAESGVSKILINIKRVGIFFTIFLGYIYYKFLGESSALVNIGLISFVAASQFAPALIGGLYWQHATKRGAIAGLLLGFIFWFYTLLLPSFINSGWLSQRILDEGLFGISLLKPLELFGLSGFDIWSHSLFWTMFFNIGGFLLFSSIKKPNAAEIEQTQKFVNAPGEATVSSGYERISKAPSIMEFVELMSKFIGDKQAHLAISDYIGDRVIDQKGSLSEFELPSLKRFTERTLAGSVGAAPAKIIIDNYLKTRGSQMEDVFNIFGSVTLSRTASREQLGILYETARIVASGQKLQKILDSVLKLLQQQFKFDLCVIRIIDTQTSTLVVKCQQGMSTRHLGSSERNLDMETYIGEAFLTNREMVINDTDYMDKPVSRDIIRVEGITSYAHTPISIEGEPIGILSAYSKTAKGIFTAEFIEMFRNLAGQIGVAWRNAEQTESLIVAREHERELDIAKRIQLSLLPTNIPQTPEFATAGICIPAKQVGGDYFDLFLRSDQHMDAVIADVSGHNVGSALIMAETRTLIQASKERLLPPFELLFELNNFFYDDLTRTELFITMFYLSIDCATSKIGYANAGHNPPMIWRKTTEQCESLDGEGLILGVKKNVLFEEKSTSLASGDVLLIYTDGITEAENHNTGEFFGEEKLKSLLASNADLPPEEIIENILDQVRLFTGVHSFNDDVSLVIIKAK